MHAIAECLKCQWKKIGGTEVLVMVSFCLGSSYVGFRVDFFFCSLTGLRFLLSAWLLQQVTERQLHPFCLNLKQN